MTDAMAAAFAAFDGDALLELLNEVHTLQAEKVARDHGVTDPALITRLQQQPDRDAMVRLLEDDREAAEYAAFYPVVASRLPDEDETEYRAFFPRGDA